MRFIPVFVFGLIFFVVVPHQNASASVEYCPVGVVAPYHFTAPNGQVYAFNLFARSRRVVNGTLLIQTNDGWYTVVFPSTPLSEFTGHFRNEYAKWQRTGYFSEPLYVRMPPVVTKVTKWTILEAQATGDNVFHWDEHGMVTCRMSATTVPDAPFFGGNSSDIVPDSPPPGNYRKPPASSDPILDASPVNLEETNSCEHPLEDAVATRKITPEWPNGAGIPARPVSVSVLVAISHDGRADDAWVEDPSGVPDFDRAALNAAANSTYRAPREMCVPTPGYYLYVVTFGPRSY